MTKMSNTTIKYSELPPSLPTKSEPSRRFIQQAEYLFFSFLDSKYTISHQTCLGSITINLQRIIEANRRLGKPYYTILILICYCIQPMSNSVAISWSILNIIVRRESFQGLIDVIYYSTTPASAKPSWWLELIAITTSRQSVSITTCCSLKVSLTACSFGDPSTGMENVAINHWVHDLIEILEF